MKAVILLAVLACALAIVSADLVCGSSYCEKHPCSSPVSSSSCHKPAVYRASHSGKCGCCPACVTLLASGATCKTYSKELGETPSAICREPLKCIGGSCQTVAPRR